MRKVFISYSSKDGEKAALVAGAIEGMGCDCWMAPRDIAPGCNYAEAIVDGLDGCTVFLLLLSSDSQASEHVVRELERSVSKGKKIMAVRLEKVSLSKSFEYFLQVTHWIDATDNLDAASLAKVANAAVALTGAVRAPEGSAPKPAQASPRKAGDAGPPPARDRAPTFEGGQKFGDFEVLSRLGQGGMGTVYKAQQISLERPVALKTLQGALASDPEYIARFRREAKAAAALNHPNLVQVYAAGETDGLHWFAMEYVEGESAQYRLKRKGRLDPAAAIAIGMNVATALDHGWRKAQLIHRDIKPDNIFLSTDGEVKLGDLGLAKSVGENQSLTMTGSSMGTPHYVSPEQAEGKKDVDLRADIYSLGCTLFHLLSGKPPFGGGTALAVMMQHVSAPVPELRSEWPECPEELSRVVLKMMAKRPADRQQSHGEVIADLSGAYRAISGGTLPVPAEATQASGTHAQPSSAHGGEGRGETPATENRRPAKKLLAIVAVALLAGIAALLYFAPWKKGAAPKPAVSDAKPAVSYAGTWKSVNKGTMGFILKEDHTGIRIQRSGEDAGTWSVDKDGAFEFRGLEKGVRWLGKFSDDGQVLSSPRSGDELRRESVSPASLVAPAPTPLPPTTPTATPVVAAKTGKIDPAKASAYAGLWYAQLNGQTYLLNEDFTAVVQKGRNGSGATGKWELIAKGVISVDIVEENPNTRVKTFRLSEDGAVLNSTTTNARWDRVLSSQANASVPPTPTAAPVVAANTGKIDPAKESSYLGTWAGKGESAFVIRADHTAIHLKEKADLKDVSVTWELRANGEFEIHFADRVANAKLRIYRLSDDGKVLESIARSGQLVRVTGAPPVPPTPAPPPPTPAPTPGSAAYYAGTWRTDGNVGVRGAVGFVLKEDFTGIRQDPEAKDEKGTWKVDKDGGFEFNKSGGGHWLGKFSTEGQSLVNTKTGGILKRVPAAPGPVKFDPANPASYVGMWTLRVGQKVVSIAENYTAIRTDNDGKTTTGTWEIADGIFRCKWSDRGTFNGKLSDDGQTMEAQGTTGAVWNRQKP